MSAEIITHKDCGGEIVSEELEIVGYEIVSDGVGGWEYKGEKAYSYGDDHGYSSFVFNCVKCGWRTEHAFAIIDGAEMTEKE